MLEREGGGGFASMGLRGQVAAHRREARAASEGAAVCRYLVAGGSSRKDCPKRSRKKTVLPAAVPLGEAGNRCGYRAGRRKEPQTRLNFRAELA